MGWKKLILLLFMFIFLINIVFAQPFGPPIYVANPDTLECKYYFSGDEAHFNPRPENYTENIGYTTDFKDKDQACLLYRCSKTGGRVLLQNKEDINPNICQCPAGFEFMNETGCTPTQTITGLTVKEDEITSKNSSTWILIFITLFIGFGFGAWFGTRFINKIK